MLLEALHRRSDDLSQAEAVGLDILRKNPQPADFKLPLKLEQLSVDIGPHRHSDVVLGRHARNVRRDTVRRQELLEKISMAPSDVEDHQRALLALMLCRLLFKQEFGESEWDAVADDSYDRGFEALRKLDPEGTRGCSTPQERIAYCKRLYDRLGMKRMRVEIDAKKYGDRKIVGD